MVSAEELSSAYTLAGLQMDVSGIIGPLPAGLLIPLAAASFMFGANGLVEQKPVSARRFGKRIQPCARSKASFWGIFRYSRFNDIHHGVV